MATDTLPTKDASSRRFVIDYAKAISGFGGALHKFPVKKILYRNMFRGKGLEFDSYRRFEPASDDATLIDWKASLRSNVLLSKSYVEERNLSVYFIVDVSNGMLFGSGEKLKAEYAAELVVALSRLIMESGDRVGLIMFSDSLVRLLPADNGRNQFAKISSSLADEELYGGGYSLEVPLEYVLKEIRNEYSVVVLVSDFIRFHKSLVPTFHMLSKRFEVFSLIIRDPMDNSLPSTDFSVMVSDPYSNRQILVDSEMVRERYARVAALHKQKIFDIFSSSSIDYLELVTDRAFFVPVTEFLRRRSAGGRQ